MDLLTISATRVGAILALAGNPWCMARLLAPRASFPQTVAVAGIASMLSNAAAIVLLHGTGIPVTPLNLAALHVAFGLVLAAVAFARRLPISPPVAIDHAVPAILAAVFAIAVAPFTYLAGIDTYKWQDLATSITVEQKVAWLIHPLSLFGFTPRAYPAIQPFLLATSQMLAGVGVEWGFYLVSLVSGITGLFAAYALAGRVFARPASAGWCALFYAFSPVFLRYNHWATGRGLFLAILPLFALCLIEARRAGWLAAAAILAIALPLAHKTGWIAVPILLAAALLSRLLPRRPLRLVTALLLGFSIAAGIALADPRPMSVPLGSLAGWIRSTGSQFAWMLPFALLGTVLLAGKMEKPPWRFAVCGLVLSLPLAGSNMYGAMVALVFMAIAATAGFAWLAFVLPRYRLFLEAALILLTLVQTSAVVGRRSACATPPRIREAARFLESYDPRGPLALVTPDDTSVRQQMQAYLSGAPRFESVARHPPTVRIRPPPSGLRHPRALAAAWVSYLRAPLETRGVEPLWYGESPRLYYVTVDGKGRHPDGAAPIYDRDGIAIYGPPASERPPQTPTP